MDSRSWELVARARRVLVLGDSITHAGQYVVMVETGLRIMRPGLRNEIINLGLPSETVSGLSEPGHAGGSFPRPDLHERLGRALEKIKPDLVLACYGMNDGIYHPFSEERFQKYQAGILRLREKVQASGAAIIHVTPPVFDPLPIRQRTLPAGREEYQQPFEGYNQVLDRYADWLLEQRSRGWLVIDIHGPMNRHLTRMREGNPQSTFAGDGVHPDETGHWLMAREILSGLGLAAEVRDLADGQALLGRQPFGKELFKLVQDRQRLEKDYWLATVGHQRPGMAKGLPLAEVRQKTGALAAQINALVPMPKPSAPYDLRQDLVPERLTIAMWDFSWLKGHYPGGPFADWAKAIAGLKERGFNTVRIEAFPILVSRYLKQPGQWLVKADPLPAWGFSNQDAEHDVPRELEQFLRLCQEQGVWVILSTWGDGRELVKEWNRQAFWGCWSDTLDFLKAKGLASQVLFVDFDQEFPFFSPFAAELDQLGQAPAKPAGDAQAAMEKAGQDAGSRPKFAWNPAQMAYVREYFTKTLAHFQKRYPELRFTFSLTSFWPEIRSMEIPFDVLELHVWIHEPRFDVRTGFGELPKTRGQKDLAGYMQRIRATMQSSRPMLLKSMENRMKFAHEWSEQLAAPLVTTEAWGPWWHMDQPDLDWDWLYEWCEQCLALAQQHGFWGVTTWNYAHPYWQNWSNVDWYRRVNQRFLDKN